MKYKKGGKMVNNYCSKCGEKIDSKAKYCSKCGEKITNNQEFEKEITEQEKKHMLQN